MGNFKDALAEFEKDFNKGGYLIPEIIEVDESSWLRKLLSKVGIVERKYKRVNLHEELMNSITEKELGTNN